MKKNTIGHSSHPKTFSVHPNQHEIQKNLVDLLYESQKIKWLKFYVKRSRLYFADFYI